MFYIAKIKVLAQKAKNDTVLTNWSTTESFLSKHSLFKLKSETVEYTSKFAKWH